jgi:aminoglycoside phosphotransferase (APT) family kinase protein
MHAVELPVDESIVRRLLAAQFPHWADLPLRRIPSSGTVNAIFRLGDELAVRAPFVPGEQGMLREAEWMPRLGPLLPVRTPRILGVGQPVAAYPSPWLVVDWIPGATPAVGALADPRQVTDELAGFIRALQRLDPAGAPPAHRSGALARHDANVREALSRIHEADVAALTDLWDRALAQPESAAPVWVHGDLLPSNILVDDRGALAAVIDMAPGLADPASELIVAWNVVPAELRPAFRAALEIDDATWARGIGWTIVQASIAIPYYRGINPGMTEMAVYALRQVLADGCPRP